MKFYEMKDVYEFIKNDLHPMDTPEWRKYKEVMDKFFNELSPYFTPIEGGNKYRSIAPKDYNRLSPLFDEAMKASYDFVHSYDNIIPDNNPHLPPINDVIVNLNDEFLSKAYVEFKNVKPNAHYALKDQMEDFRYTAVEITNDEIKKVGANQSSRLQLNVNLDGKEVKGVFTPTTFFSFKKEVTDIFPMMANRYPKYQDFFNSFDPDSFYKKTAVLSNMDIFYTSDGTFKNGPFAEDTLKEYLKGLNLGANSNTLKIANKYIKEPEFFDAVFSFVGEVEKYRTQIGLNSFGIGIKEGERVDNRNSAMAAVGNLLGKPNLLVKTRPLAIYDEKGHKYQEGTFMEFAKGKDINNLAPIDEMRLADEKSFDTPEVKRQLADMQILDYICGNIDRHSGNMLYDYDPVTKKVKGLVGIDNDCSFLKNDIKSNIHPLVRLPGINSLRVIDEEMAERVSKLTEGELKNTLHGYGLDKKAIDKAWERTQQLQSALANANKFSETGRLNFSDNNKKIRINIVNKNDWSKITLSSLGRSTKNYFSMIKESAWWLDKGEPIGARLKRGFASSISGLKASISKAQTSTLYKKAKDASPWFFASNRYKNILTKLKEYNDEAITTDNKGLINLDQAKFTKLGELKEAINTYKSEKIKDGFIDKDWNLKRPLSGKDLDRINIVKGMETYVKSVEEAKKSTLEIKAKLDARTAYVNETAEFLKKGTEVKEALVDQKLEEEKALKQNIIENEINVSDNITHDLNNDIGETNYSFLDKNIFKEEVVKEKNLHSDKDLEVEIEENNLAKSI